MKIGLALSGGGAIGAAHIGVLESLEKENIKIEYISGASAGAIVALLYADGGLSAIENFLKDLEQAGLCSKTTLLLKRNETIFSTIEEILRKNVKAKLFHELNIKYSCVATDILTGEPVTLTNGDPISATMASAAYRGVFPAQKIGNKHLVDGALTMNLPASVLKENGADFIIGSSLYSLSEIEKPNDPEEKVKFGLLSVASRSIDIMSKVLSEYEMKNCDFCFTPPVGTYSWYRIDKVAAIKECGQKYAQEKMPELKENLLSYKKPKKKTFWQNIFGK